MNSNMPPKKIGKKKRKEDSMKAKRKLEAFWIKEIDEQMEDFIDDMLIDEEATCNQIRESYTLGLKGIPQKYHHMTLKQISEFRKKTPPGNAASSSKCLSAISSRLLKIKSMTEKRNLSTKQKKNAVLVKKLQMNKKISTTTVVSRNISSTSNCGQPNRKALATVQQTAMPSTSSSSNVYHKGCATPMWKKRVVHTHTHLQKKPVTSASLRQAAVTPKFNPKAPLSSTLLRKPKPGEVIMSLSGSPLQNPVPKTIVTHNTHPKKPSLLIPLANGKVLNMAETSNLSSLGALKLDQMTKATLMNVQERLAGLLRA